MRSPGSHVAGKGKTSSPVGMGCPEIISRVMFRENSGYATLFPSRDHEGELRWAPVAAVASVRSAPDATLTAWIVVPFAPTPLTNAISELSGDHAGSYS